MTPLEYDTTPRPLSWEAGTTTTAAYCKYIYLQCSRIHVHLTARFTSSFFPASQLVLVFALDEMHTSAVLNFACPFLVKSQLELVRVTREASRHRHRRHPSRRGLAQAERLRAGYRCFSWS